MTEKTEVKKPKLAEKVAELAAKLEKGIELDKGTGVGKAGETLYTDNLPEGLTPELVDQVSTYNANFIAAGAYAFGTLAVNAMAGNKKLERANIEFKMGENDNVRFTVDREKKTVDTLHGGGEIVKHGVLSHTYEVRAGKNSGQLKAARKLVGELAMAKLK